MKQLLIPVLIAVLAGVGGGSGFAYMRSAKAFVADSIQLADSLKAHPPAKAAPTDKHAGPNTMPVEEPVLMTPADSLRALEAARAASHGVGAVDTSHAAKPASAQETPGKPATDKPAGDKPAATAAGGKAPAGIAPPTVSATADLA